MMKGTIMQFPQYNSDESIVKLKLEMKLPLSDDDKKSIRLDISKKFYNTINSNPDREDILAYLDSKYVGWSDQMKIEDVLN